MLTSNATSPNNPRWVEGTSSQPNDNSNDLLCIEPSVLQGRVQFRRPSLLRTIHETYSRDEYDRTSIKVRRRKLALPERGDRIYFHDNTSNSDTPSDVISELDDLAAQCRQLSIADGTVQNQESRVRLMPLPHHPNTGVANPRDSAEDDAVPGRPPPLHLRRPATPLPPLFLDDSEDEDENGDTSGVASPLTDVSGSDESDGCLSPPPHSPSIDRYSTANDARSYFRSSHSQASTYNGELSSQSKTHVPRTVPALYAESSSSSSDESGGPLSPRHGPTSVIILPKVSDAEFTWQSGLNDIEGCLGGF